MLYMGWQIMDTKKPLPSNIRLALEYYEKKFGRVPNVVELGYKVERKEYNVPELESIRFRPIDIPANILLIGVDDEKANVRVEVDSN